MFNALFTQIEKSIKTLAIFMIVMLVLSYVISTYRGLTDMPDKTKKALFQPCYDMLEDLKEENNTLDEDNYIVAKNREASMTRIGYTAEQVKQVWDDAKTERHATMRIMEANMKKVFKICIEKTKESGVNPLTQK